MEDVVLFTVSGCKNCITLERLLTQKGIPFEKETDVQKIIELGFSSAPILKVGREIHDFNSARNLLLKI